MGWSRKRGWDDPPAVDFLHGAQRRIAGMSTKDLYDWAEVGVSGIGRALSDFQHRSDPAGLVEAEAGTVVLLDVVRELVARAHNDSALAPLEATLHR